MTITKRGFICLAAGLLAASLFAGPHHHRPFPHGTPPGAYWCPKCDGDGYNWTWYGWKKTCGVCDGRGWLVKKNPPPPVVAPRPHHGKPAPTVAPTPVHRPAPKPAHKVSPSPTHKAAPTPAHKPASKPAPNGGPRR